MKKLFIVLAVASLGFVACNNDSDKETTVDSTSIKDSTIPPIVTPDTVTLPAPDTIKTDSVAAPAK